MQFFRNAPFIRILPSFSLGIVLSFFSELRPTFFWFLLIIAFLATIIFSSIGKVSYSWRLIPGLILQIILFSLGFLLTTLNDQRNDSKHFSKFDCEIYRAVIESQPVYKSGRLRAEAEVKSVYFQNEWKTSCGKLYLYFSDSTDLFCSDEIIFTEPPEGISPKLNPGSFDFQYHSSLKRIYYQTKLNGKDWQFVNHHTGLKYYSIKLRNEFLDIFRRAGLKGQEYAVMSALVLGYDDEIDKSVMSAFSASGTLHVLSVSGMHVGIIFGALSILMRFADRTRALRIFRSITLLICLWFYALLTGLSPSVIRSAMMFSFILMGSTMKRSSNIYNSLALSALAIFILFDTVLILHPGFQLSYIAVAGIAYFYPKFYKLFYFQNWIVDKIYSLIAVSIAAQLATFPLVIYYFHSFPNYFILANLIIIPVSTIGIFGGIALLFLSNFEFLLVKAGSICSFIIQLLNNSASIIENLPYSTLSGLMFGLPGVFLLLIFFILMTEFFGTRNIKLLYSSLVCFILFWSSVIAAAIEINSARSIIFFSGTNEMCFQYNSGFNSILYYAAKDSSKAKQISDAYCNSAGRSISLRQEVCSGIENNSPDLLVFQNGQIILIGSHIILNNPDKLYYNNPLCIYYSQKKFREENTSSSFTKIIINDLYSKNANKEIRPGFNRLSKGAVEILLGG